MFLCESRKTRFKSYCILSTGYVIEKCDPRREEWIPVNSTPCKGTSFTVPNLVEGQDVMFRVAAVNDAGPGRFSKATEPHKVRDPICEFI